MAWFTIADLKQAYHSALGTGDDAELTLCIADAQKYVEQYTGRESIEDAAYTEYFDGDGVLGRKKDTIYLNAGRRPVIHSGGTLVTVTEDGAALTVTTGYSTTAAVHVYYANEDRICKLVRAGVWSTGRQNIAVTYTAGYTVVPSHIVRVGKEVAWLIFRSREFLGKSSTSGSRNSVTWEKDLSPMSKNVLESLRVI